MERARSTIERLVSRPAFAWTIAAVLGILNVLPNRFAMNPDGISYMNLATHYMRGDWSGAVNGYWSPLYPMLLALTFRIAPASAYYESSAVHWLTLVLYLAAFGAFRFFLAELRASQTVEPDANTDAASALSFQSLAENGGAYALFFWAAFTLIGVALVTPDFLLAALIFAAAGLAIRLARRGPTSGYLALGAIIGLAYLTKAVMFPIGIVMCLATGLFAGTGPRFRRTLFAVAGFFIVASPQVIAMSRISGRFSYGESGTVAYANEVNRVPKFWTGEPAGSGTPVNPMREISRNPRAYDFSLPDATFSYPVSDKLAYWMNGVQTRVSFVEQAGVTKRIVGWYVWVFEILIFALLILYLISNRLSGRYLALVVTGLSAFALYALVFAETRYLGAWAVIVFLCVASSMRFEAGSRRGAAAVMGALAAFYGVSTLNLTRSETLKAFAMSKDSAPNVQFETAKAFALMNFPRGVRVASIGYSFNAYWARLAGVQIAMQVPDEPGYSIASASVRGAILRAFRDAGAVAVISTGKPFSVPGEDWRPLGPAGYWILDLRGESVH